MGRRIRINNKVASNNKVVSNSDSKTNSELSKSKSKERYNAINRSIDNVLSDIKELIEGNDKNQ